MANQYEIVVDEENNAEEWWDAAQDHVGQYRDAVQSLVSEGRLVVGADARDQLLSWAKSLPGWATGPAYAKHPLLVNEVEG